MDSLRSSLPRGAARSAPALVALLALVTLVLPAAPVRAQATGGDAVPYTLNGSTSSYDWGCFGPCACPVLMHMPLVGTFTLRLSHSDPLFTYYDVLDARFRVTDGQEPVVLAGSGTYRRGGEVAISEQMVLDLSLNGGSVRRYDSGTVAPRAQFPAIRVELALHGPPSCFDTVVVVDAKPATTGVDGSRPQLVSLTPNPTRATADVAFTLPFARAVDLAVFDLAGRCVRTLARHEALEAGAHVRTWDGRLDGGGEARAGLYVIRLAAPEVSTRVLAKLC